MVDRSVIQTVRHYLAVLLRQGIPVKYSVLFGSYARGDQRAESDVDLFVVSEAFQDDWPKWNERVWELTAYSDAMIEPTPVTEDELVNDNTSLRLEMARREGIVIYPDDAIPPTRLDESGILLKTGNS
ncbi:MAG: nucleotidyltransferase domain-containing protein [Candidatus Coatesbacteria bacterium]|nr:nucleotidyltransferase domain-containing protein [Candidatus Coatesbacteria bacterium]